MLSTRSGMVSLSSWENQDTSTIDTQLVCVIYNDVNKPTTKTIFRRVKLDDAEEGSDEDKDEISNSLPCTGHLPSSNPSHLAFSCTTTTNLGGAATSCPTIPDSGCLHRHSKSKDDLGPSAGSEGGQISHPSLFMDAETNNMGKFNVEQDNYVLEHAFRAHLIVIDSLCPEKVPHILISPANTTLQDEYVAWANRPNPQWSGCLSVPPCAPSVDSVPSDSYQPKILGAVESPCASAKKVFHRRSFEQMIEDSSAERLIMYHVVTAVHRHALKASIYGAALRAKYLSAARTIFKDPLLPYKWTDPAAPLLSSFSRLPGNQIFESNDPFRAPHIVLSEAPVPNPWIAWMNTPPDQYLGRLTVPGRHMVYNYWSQDKDLGLSTDKCDDAESVYAYSSSSEEPFEVETRPCSPTDLEGVERCFSDIDGAKDRESKKYYSEERRLFGADEFP